MNLRTAFSSLLLLGGSIALLPAQSAPQVFGYTGFGKEAQIEAEFLAVPSAQLAGEHLKTLTAVPHMAATPGDRRTAAYVEREFKAAGLDTEVVPYRVLLNQPKVVRVEAYDATGHLLMKGPTPEHVDGDPYEGNPRAAIPFNGSSWSGDVTAEVVYANYGRLEDYKALEARHIDVKGKIVLCRYGANFRGVKVYLAQQRGAAGVLLYSDPKDDGYAKGAVYPKGPWRPATAIQYGSVQYLFEYPGDPETPGVASTVDLPDSARVPDATAAGQPKIISIPISYHDAEPILKSMTGPEAPTEWQGALPFKYHLGPGGVRVHLVSRQDYKRRIIWDVIGTIRGTQYPGEWVIAGNHRDAWIYGAVDPSSGTAAMLEAVHGFGALLKQGWRPKRTVVFCSWDAEEEGLVGSTEWVEQHAADMAHAVAYFNMDVAVAGPNFSASAVPSLKEFVEEVTRSVPSPLGGTVYEQWKTKSEAAKKHGAVAASGEGDVHVGDLGSGSDFTPFLQHAGVPSTDVGSDGPYGVYHSVFDDYAWYIMNADPKFVYLQEMARVFGLEALRMADSDVLPYDYVTYAREVASFIARAKRKAQTAGMSALDFGPAEKAAAQLAVVAIRVHGLELQPTGGLEKLNVILRQTETDLLNPAGLPNRPWYKHTIFAPGEYTGYAAVLLPGVNEAIDAGDAARAASQLSALTAALERAAATLDKAQ